MRDISHKIITHRKAIAESVLKMKSDSVERVKTNTGPKKDILATARAASYLAVKNTASVIPHCHPLPIENVKTEFEFSERELKVLVEVETIYKTGCEIEAIHGAQIAALTIYDMLKPVDKDIEISSTRLLKKSGGKSDFRKERDRDISAQLIVMSDSISSGKKEDKAGAIICDILETSGVRSRAKVIIPDEGNLLEEEVGKAVKNKADLILTCGGTGLAARDITPETLRPLFDREVNSIMEAARSYGQERTPYAMLSRGVAGFIKNSLVISLPGSSRGARETMNALFPSLLHLFDVQKKFYQHENVDND